MTLWTCYGALQIVVLLLLFFIIIIKPISTPYHCAALCDINIITTSEVSVAARYLFKCICQAKYDLNFHNIQQGCLEYGLTLVEANYWLTCTSRTTSWSSISARTFRSCLLNALLKSDENTEHINSVQSEGWYSSQLVNQLLSHNTFICYHITQAISDTLARTRH